MIIDKDGNINMMGYWWEGNGPTIKDSENPYGIEFSITLNYTDEQREQYLQICKLKKNLQDTDYKVNKYVEGEYTEEEYAPIKAQRSAWRAEINAIEKDFHPPTLTREEIDYAERIAMENWEKFKQKEKEEVNE